MDNACAHFLKFCRDNDIAQAESFLHTDFDDVNFPDEDGLTPLQIVAAYGNVDLAESLLNHGANVHAFNTYGCTALHHASFNGNSEMVELLIRRGAKVDAKNLFGATPLCLASKCGHAEVVLTLIKSRAELLSIDNEEDEIAECDPLSLAILYGHENVSKILMVNGADINSTIGSIDYSLLMLAAIKGQLTVLQLLIDSGADLDRKNAISGRDSIQLAESQKLPDVVALLEQCSGQIRSRCSTLANPSPNDDIMEAVRKVDIARVREILADEPTFADYVKSDDGCTPLILASIMGNIELVKLFVSKGADVNRKDKIKGWTALMQACFFRNVEVAKYLIWNGSDCNIKSDDNFSALDLAIIADYSDIPEQGLLALLSQKTIEQDQDLLSRMPLRKANTLTNRSVSNFSLTRRRGLLMATSTTSLLHFITKKVRPVRLTSDNVALKSTGRWSRTKFWWNRFKCRLSTRTRSSANLHALIHDNDLRPSKNAKRSQSAGDLLSLQCNLTRTLNRFSFRKNELNSIRTPVVPPFEITLNTMTTERKMSTTSSQFGKKASTFSISATNLNSILSPTITTTKLFDLNKDILPINSIPTPVNGNSKPSFDGFRSLAMRNAARMRPTRKVPNRISTMHKYENIMEALRLPATIEQNGLSRNTGSPNSSHSTSSLSSRLQLHLPAVSSMPVVTHKKRFQNFQPAVNHVPLTQGLGRKRGALRPYSYHDAFSENCDLSRQNRSSSYSVTSGDVGDQRLNMRISTKSLRDENYTPSETDGSGSQIFHDKLSSQEFRNQETSSTLKMSADSLTSCGMGVRAIDLEKEAALSLIAGVNKRLSMISSNFPLIGNGINGSFDGLRLSEDQMECVLKQLAAEPYSSIFDDEELDLATFVTLTEGDLREMGIHDPAPRNKILKLIRQVNSVIMQKKRQKRYTPESRDSTLSRSIEQLEINDMKII